MTTNKIFYFLYFTFSVYGTPSTTVGPSFNNIFSFHQSSPNLAEQHLPEDAFNFDDLSKQMDLSKQNFDEVNELSKTLDNIHSMAADATQQQHDAIEEINEDLVRQQQVIEARNNHVATMKLLKIGLGLLCGGILLALLCYKKCSKKRPIAVVHRESILVIVAPNRTDRTDEEQTAFDPKTDTPPPSYEEAVVIPPLPSAEELLAKRQQNQIPA